MAVILAVADVVFRAALTQSELDKIAPISSSILRTRLAPFSGKAERIREMAQSFDPPSVWSPFGAFSQSVILGGGQIVYLKGQVALGRDGQIVGEGDMGVQVGQVLQNMSDVLAAMGGKMSDVISLQQFTTDIQAFMQCGEVRTRFFKPPYPVTTTLEVSSLYDPRLLIEITGIAEIPLDRFSPPETAQEMHQ